MTRRHSRRRGGQRTQDHHAQLRALNSVEREKWSSDFAVTCGDCACVLGRAVDSVALSTGTARTFFFVHGVNLSKDGVYRFSNEAKKHIARFEEPHYRRGWLPVVTGRRDRANLTPESYPCRVVCPGCDTTQIVDENDLGLVAVE